MDKLQAEKLDQAERLRAAIDKKGWSAGRLARELTNRGVKVSRTTAYQWIDDKNPSTPSDWAAIADVLDETVEWLRDGKASHSAVDTAKFLGIFRVVVNETTEMGYSLSEEQLVTITSMIYNRTPGPVSEVDRSLIADAIIVARL